MADCPAQHIDWPRVIDDLSGSGFGMRRLAQRLGVGKSTVRGWRRGSEPSHADGELVLRIWCERTGSALHDAPRTQWFGRMHRLFR